ncbi:hypothetical protein RRG08_000766 [Elysia crispata]|uniref:Uncharacterized protein n=1 Tax=Elysia crispata TaxID=231223 RepID=A0AAE0YM80_9GAST|nr:hypothetical protein RRG08_000766 [Elysia crispata]
MTSHDVLAATWPGLASGSPDHSPVPSVQNTQRFHSAGCARRHALSGGFSQITFIHDTTGLHFSLLNQLPPFILTFTISLKEAGYYPYSIISLMEVRNYSIATISLAEASNYSHSTISLTEATIIPSPLFA